ncbi:uncharacterized protein [Henckelia pumila]|uniref:uncharacterized protein n=1 Tax=Henckelia pumila TaxID=405737 RepID=UPI003C6DD325
MLGSIDCMHWAWKNCPAAWAGQYQSGHQKEPSITLQAVASKELWIWHAYFGVSGCNNDINILKRSKLFLNLAKGEAPPVQFEVNGNEYNMGYYLADGIYPSWAAFVKTIPRPLSQKHRIFAQYQEGLRKDVERAFGVLQARWHIVRCSSRLWDPIDLDYIMKTCIILHNMIVEDEREDILEDHDFPTRDDEHVPPNVVPSRDPTLEFNAFLEQRTSRNPELRRELLIKIQNILDEHNPFVHVFRQIGQREDIPNCRLIIRKQQPNEHQYNLPTASQVAAVIVDNECQENLNARDIIIQGIGGNLISIQDIVGYYDPLQYPLFLPHGTYGWDINSRNIDGTQLTCLNYYAYILQIREHSPSLLLRGGRLFQQYVVDNYLKIETQRLRWIRSNQREIRSELYQGLQDCLHGGENNAGNVGTRIVLPSSFGGSPRDMYQRYQDTMTLVQTYGKPDIMLTMTCNPNWSEIKYQLLPGQSSQDHPDLITRIFRSKFEEFKKDIVDRGVLEKVLSYSYVIEYQKRGLPHVHMLIIFEKNDKLCTPDHFDSIVRAEIPSKIEQPNLHGAVVAHMIHGPCGSVNPNCPCMINGKCKKNFPNPFVEYTSRGNDSYPLYRRRQGAQVLVPNNDEIFIDNGWVVPYNPYLLLKYDCHINVEVCGGVKCVKYIYKYIHKAPDRVALEIRNEQNCDEIQQYVDGRWICAPEALCRIFSFDFSRMYPSVIRLQLHTPNQHLIYFLPEQHVSDLIADDDNSKTMLTEFFKMNCETKLTGKYLYQEFPQYYTWIKAKKVDSTKKQE